MPINIVLGFEMRGTERPKVPLVHMQHFADNPGQAKRRRHGERWRKCHKAFPKKPVAARRTDNDAERKGRQGKRMVTSAGDQL